MAKPNWIGTATAIKQISTVQVTADDNTTTYKMTIGDKVVSVLGTGTGVNDTATALKDALVASTNGYFKAAVIVWTVATDTVTGTAAIAGIPFTVTSSVSGGAGTIGAVAESTAPTGPNHWDEPTNWDTGVAPVTGDTVTVQDNSINILFGLDQNAVDLAKLAIAKSYTGKIGLDYRVFTTSGVPATDSTEIEYRDIYLKIGSTIVDIGKDFSTGDPAGSARILLDLDTTVSTVSIFGTASTASEVGRPAIRLKGVNSSNDLFVRSAPGGVGIAIDKPNEVSTFRKVSISDTSSGSKVEIGSGTTLTTFEQNGGINVLQLLASGTLTTLTMEGGTLTTEGDWGITTANVNFGTLLANHDDTGGDSIDTLNIDNGGIIDGQGSNAKRTWGIVNLKRGGSIAADSNFVTITTLNEPSGPYVLNAS